MNRTIYLDMDGVVASFVEGALSLHGKTLPMAECRWNFMEQVGFAADDPAFWGPIENPHFWRNLPTLADGMELYRLLTERYGDERLNVLSSAKARGSKDGKDEWLQCHMPRHVDCAVYAHRKERVASSSRVLVDDFESNVDKFVQADGVAVLVPRPWNRRRNECVDGWWFDVNQVFDEVVFATEYGISNIWEK